MDYGVITFTSTYGAIYAQKVLRPVADVLTMPVLVIAGTEDIILEDHTKLIADSLPDGKLVWIKGDHFIARDNPDDFNAAVDEFLGIKK